MLDMLPIHDVVALPALIDGYCEHEHGKGPLLCFQQMQPQGVPPNGVTYTGLLKTCESVGAFNERHTSTH